MRKIDDKNSPIVASRKGDEFHYRWAARRSLHLLNPSSGMRRICIEGDQMPVDADEGLDVVEIFEKSSPFTKIYDQLKYSAAHEQDLATISTYKKNINKFIRSWMDPVNANERILCRIITNQPTSDTTLNELESIRAGMLIQNRTWITLRKWNPELSDDALVEFCKHFEIIGDEISFDAQLLSLQAEASALTPEPLTTLETETLINLVRNKVFSKTTRTILPEDVITTLGLDVSSPDMLFPAPRQFEKESQWIKPQNFNSALLKIINSDGIFVVHGNAGSGKTVFMQHLAATIPKGSRSVIFDCFGSGSYRSETAYRHRHQEALVQINNELAAQDLCPFLIPRPTQTPDAYTRKFFKNIAVAIKRLRTSAPTACVYIFADAADNAKDASKEFGDEHDCFVDALLNSAIPDGCKIILSARTVRLDRITSSFNDISQIPISPFTITETVQLAKKLFPKISDHLSSLLQTRTGGIPRCIINKLHNASTLAVLTRELASERYVTMETILNAQRKKAEAKLREQYPDTQRKQFGMLYRCMTILPPNIPIKILSAATNLSHDLIDDFIAEFGYPFWRDGDLIHFRDEPTETWFKDNFESRDSDLITVIKRLRPLITQHIYVADVFPRLLFKAKKFDELLKLVADKTSVPTDLPPAGQRQLFMARLKYALGAALQTSRFEAAFRMAFLAGDEEADGDCIHNLIMEHMALFSVLQPPYILTTLAASHTLHSCWRGSENLYAAALLSNIPHEKDRARALLTSAENWFYKYYEEQDRQLKSNPHKRFANDKPTRTDIGTLSYCILVLFGPADALRFLKGWTTKGAMFRAAEDLASILGEIRDIENLNALAEQTYQMPHLFLPFCHVLCSLGASPSKRLLRPSLNFLATPPKVRALDEPRHNHRPTLEILTLCEASARSKISKRAVLKVLNQRYIKLADYDPLYNVHGQNETTLRAFALNNILGGAKITPNKILSFAKKRNHCLDPYHASEHQKELASTLPKIEDKEYQRVYKSSDWANAEQAQNENSDSLLVRASAYIRKDPNDAREYLNQEIEKLSSVDEDPLSHWQALEAVAEAAITPDTNKTFIYRFTKCGEHVRKNVARDKYFDRFRFFRTLSSYSESYSLALFSRWRSRNVGYFEEDFPYFLGNLLHRGILHADDIRPLSPLFDGNYDPLQPERPYVSEYEQKEKAECDAYYLAFEPQNALNVLNDLITSDEKDSLETLKLLAHFPTTWKQKPSVKTVWKKKLMQFASRIAMSSPDFVAESALSFFEKEDPSLDIVRHYFNALGRNTNISGFGFFRLIAYGVNILDSPARQRLLDFALKAIERNVKSDFGDGQFTPRFFPRTSPSQALAELIWCILGSSRTKQRWRAVHAVANITSSGNDHILRHLFTYLEGKRPTACFPSQYPFYHLTAQVHFLIGLLRGSQDAPSAVKPYCGRIKAVALRSSHIQIIHFANQILSRTDDDTSLKTFLETKHPLIHRGSFFAKSTDPTLSALGHPCATNFEIPYYFEEDWCDALGSVFGAEHGLIPNMIKLYADRLRENEYSGSGIFDPRQASWDDNDHNETFFHHYEYPTVDSYAFYLSYHALMQVAYKLLQDVPIMEDYDGSNPWTEWLNTHVLTRADGLLVADAKESPPDTFTTNQSKYHHLDQLQALSGCKDFITVLGEWHRNDYNDKSSCYITYEIISRDKHPKALLQEESGTRHGIDFLDPLTGNINYAAYPVPAGVDANDFSQHFYSSADFSCYYKREASFTGRSYNFSLSYLRAFCLKNHCRIKITVRLYPPSGCTYIRGRCQATEKSFTITSKGLRRVTLPQSP